jgi:hypothetical protein
MYTLYLAIFIGATLGLITAIMGADDDGPAKLLVYVIGTAIGAIPGTFVGGVIGLIVLNFVPQHQVVYGPTTLVSMRSSDGVSGTFLLGSGGINSQMEYNYYVRNDDGTFTPYHQPANGLVRITEDKTLKDVGYWTTIMKEYDQSASISAWALGLNDRTILHQDFRVPVGTVVQSFNVN